ncbi:MAG: Membrane-associated zinc metalloprotease [Evtepia sp.]|nr:Membrane-associated zinc metalloprotease [Evtepia sp.]
MLLYVLIAIFLFGVLIAIHEWGHFITAKLMGVRVNEFSIGMGPVLFSKQKGETRYSLRAIPMGGFCAMEGEDEDTDAPDSFLKKPAWKKLVILSAGSFMNFVGGVLLLLLLFSQAHSFSVPVIADFMDGFPNESQEGLIPGDRIVSIDGHKVHIVSDTQVYFSLSNGETMDLVIERNGQLLERKDFPLKLREYTADGTKTIKYGLYFAQVDATPGEVLRQSWDTSLFFVRSVWLGLQMLFQGDAGLKDMSGPVGIVSMIGETGSHSGSLAIGLKNVCYIIALVAVNLAVVNMLPIPALDGGRIFLILINQGFYLVTRRRINPQYESYIHTFGFVFLIGLMVIVTFFDVTKLVR